MTIEIWGKEACPSCKSARQFCRGRELEFDYKILGVDFTREEIFEQFPGAKTFPQIRINGENIGGYEQLVKYVEDTGYTGTGHSL
jgi:glutaredoxin